ncbi:serpin B12 isoform X2 [Otolemur garnettii]|uniref:serpin B12 isoform X2 n=1 Tax=Otolemur garnettii TaxID=30611 RepID=UPI0006444932|nr:serpin B12 isoform X2 [Otolemur garnettii]
MDVLVAANTKFCFDLFRKISKDDYHKNVFFCPLSLSASLAMVRFGARHASAHQIDNVLHFLDIYQSESKEPDPCLKSNKQEAGTSKDESALLSCYFGKLLCKLDRAKTDCTLSIANRLYGEQEFPIHPAYTDGVIQFYHTTIESVDFQRNSEKSRQEINYWVESQSQGKIKDLFSKDTINDTTVLVLVNAVYFKPKWENYFDSENTVDALFSLNEKEKKNVKMMTHTGLHKLAFLEELIAHVLEMRCSKGELSMLVLLPSYSDDNLKGLEELERKITYEHIVAWSNSENMSEKMVAVSLPQFTLEDSYDLNSVLEDMGIVDIFDETKADLTGISPTPNLCLSKIVHKTFLEVDENGTQPAAASGAVGPGKSAPSLVEFNANHPFLFLIRHNKTQTILFYGRVCSP